MSRLTVIHNTEIAQGIFRLELCGAKPHEPGEFVMIQVSEGTEMFFRRPFSIADSERERLTILYQVVGKGTRYLSGLSSGNVLDVLERLGHGFRIEDDRKDVCLIGGGSGMFPLYGLAKTLAKRQVRVTTVLGFQSQAKVCLIPELSEYSEVHICTMDGSLGKCGNISLYEPVFRNTYYYAVGPLAMLQAIAQCTLNGQMSLEERMGCGFGACMGCTIQTRKGPKQVCLDGPVFAAGDLIWT